MRTPDANDARSSSNISNNNRIIDADIDNDQRTIEVIDMTTTDDDDDESSTITITTTGDVVNGNFFPSFFQFLFSTRTYFLVVVFHSPDSGSSSGMIDVVSDSGRIAPPPPLPHHSPPHPVAVDADDGVTLNEFAVPTTTTTADDDADPATTTTTSTIAVDAASKKSETRSKSISKQGVIDQIFTFQDPLPESRQSTTITRSSSLNSRCRNSRNRRNIETTISQAANSKPQNSRNNEDRSDETRRQSSHHRQRTTTTTSTTTTISSTTSSIIMRLDSFDSTIRSFEEERYRSSNASILDFHERGKRALYRLGMLPRPQVLITDPHLYAAVTHHNDQGDEDIVGDGGGGGINAPIEFGPRGLLFHVDITAINDFARFREEDDVIWNEAEEMSDSDEDALDHQFQPPLSAQSSSPSPSSESNKLSLVHWAWRALSRQVGSIFPHQASHRNRGPPSYLR